MLQSARARAEKQFAATQKKDQPALNELEKEARGRTENTARLRALRLGKEAADQKAAGRASANKVVGTRKKAPRWPQARLSG